MALENLFIRTKRSIGGIQLDSILSEDHYNSVTVTQHPVEFGANISDHAIINPARLTIVGEVTDTPLGLQAFNQIIDDITGLFGSSTSDSQTRSAIAFNGLVQLKNARELIDVQTGLKLYTNMLITDISTIQDKDTSRVVKLIISLEELLVVSSETVTLDTASLESGTTAAQGAPVSSKGRQEVSTPSDTTQKTWLKTIKDFIL